MHLIQAVIQHDSDISVEEKERQSSFITRTLNKDTTPGTTGKKMTDEKTTSAAAPPVEGETPATNDSETKTVESPQDKPEEEEAESSEETTTEEAAPVSEEAEVAEESSESATTDEKVTKKVTVEELEAKAIAEATASANASYTPPMSLLNSSSPYPLVRSVDGMSLKKYNPSPSVYTARDVPVPLRGKLNIPVHVTLGGSIVEYTVECKDYDIGFGIVAERDEGLTVVSALQRTDANLKPITGKFLVGSVPCAIIFTFDNEYSWFREKRISYQITIKPPTKENIISGRKIRAEAALKVVAKDLISAEERLEDASAKVKELTSDVERLEKELEEKKKSLGVIGKEEDVLKKRVQLRSVQEDLLNRRLADGWEDENELSDEDDEVKEDTPERAEI